MLKEDFSLWQEAVSPAFRAAICSSSCVQAQKMQQQMMKAQEDLDAREYEGTAGGGAVSCKVSGKRQLLSLTIDKDAVDPGRSRNASGHDCRGRQRRAQEG